MKTTKEKRKILRELLNQHKKGYWRTKDGKLIKEHEMDDTHVSNLLDYIDRNNLVVYWQCDATKADIY